MYFIIYVSNTFCTANLDTEVNENLSSSRAIPSLIPTMLHGARPVDGAF